MTGYELDRLSPDGFTQQTIVLTDSKKLSQIQEKVPFRLKTISQATVATSVKHRASYSRDCGISNGKLSNWGRHVIFGVEILSTTKAGIIVVWWGLLRLNRRPDEGGPLLCWGSEMPVCFVQSWRDLTGTSVFDEGMARWHWYRVEKDIRNSERGILVETRKSWSMPEDLKRFRQSVPTSVQDPMEIFTASAQSTVEYKRDALHVKAAMERVEFLGRELCQLNLEFL